MKRRQLLLHGIQLAVVAAIGWAVYRGVAPRVAELRQLDLTAIRPAAAPLVLATVLLLLVYWTHAVIWRHITGVLSERHVPFRGAMRAFFVSSLGRYLPGKLWQIAGLAVLAQQAGISALAATAAILVGQAAYLSTGIVFLALLLPERAASALLGLAVFVAISAVLFVVGSTQRGKRIRERVLGRLGGEIQEAARLLDRVTIRRAFVWWLAYAGSWVVFGMSFVLFVAAFWDGARPAYIAGAIAASYLVGYLSLLPGGIGVRELAMLGLLTAGGLPADVALVVSVSSRLWFTVGELLPLGIIPLLPRDSPPQPSVT